MREIKKIKGLAALPTVIVVTAFGREQVRNTAQEVGAEAFLVKPVNQSTLFDTIMTIFGKEQAAPVAALGGRRTGAQVSLTGKRILLAEDNEINQLVAIEILQAEGIIVDVAGNGREALQMVKGRHYDAVLMDLQMPEMDGFEATQLIREDRRFQRLPIIAMTAHAMVEERAKCLASGMNDHVAKPVDPDLLFAALAKWIRPPEPLPAVADEGQKVKHRHAEDTPVTALPDQVAGFDMAAARTALGNNEALLARLFADFLAKYTSYGDKIAEALAAGDGETAERTAHSLKGVSGTLCATRVYAAATAVDAALRDDPAGDGAQDLLRELSEALDEVRQSLTAAIGTN